MTNALNVSPGASVDYLWKTVLWRRLAGRAGRQFAGVSRMENSPRRTLSGRLSAISATASSP